MADSPQLESSPQSTDWLKLQKRFRSIRTSDASAVGRVRYCEAQAAKLLKRCADAGMFDLRGMKDCWPSQPIYDDVNQHAMSWGMFLVLMRVHCPKNVPTFVQRFRRDIKHENSKNAIDEGICKTRAKRNAAICQFLGNLMQDSSAEVSLDASGLPSTSDVRNLRTRFDVDLTGKQFYVVKQEDGTERCATTEEERELNRLRNEEFSKKTEARLAGRQTVMKDIEYEPPVGDPRYQIYVQWVNGLLPNYRPTATDLEMLALEHARKVYYSAHVANGENTKRAVELPRAFAVPPGVDKKTLVLDPSRATYRPRLVPVAESTATSANGKPTAATVASGETPPDAPPALPIDPSFAGYRSLTWHGIGYTFTTNQAACLKVLFEAKANRTPDIADGDVLDRANVNNESRLSNVFRNRRGNRVVKHEAWGVLIVSCRKGTHRIADEPPVTSGKKLRRNGKSRTTSRR